MENFLTAQQKAARGKASSYLKSEIRSASDSSRCVWQHVNLLLEERRSKIQSSFMADQYHNVMDKKTADIRAATASADDLVYVVNKWSQLEKCQHHLTF